MPAGVSCDKMKGVSFMKKILLTASVFCAFALAAETVIDCNYAGQPPVAQSKFGAPVIQGETNMAGKPAALVMNGKNNYITFPGSNKFSLQNGGSLYAVIKPGANESFGMTFFKNKEFLLGVYQKKFLYFNLMPNVKPDCPLFLPKLEMGKWMSVAAVVKVTGKDYTVTLYVSGKKPVTKTFKNVNYKATDAEITFGRGWGSTWHFDGSVALFKAFDKPLSEKEIKALDAECPVKL